MSYKERFATDLASTHLEGGEKEKAIDRIAAHARASRLGRALWRWKYAADDRMAYEAQMSLVRGLCRRWGISKGHTLYVMVVRVAKRALHEWHSDQCPDCRGAEYVQAGSLRIVCQTCKGTGASSPRDADRMRAICNEGLKPAARVAQWAEWEPRFREARDMIVSADVGVTFAMKDALGKT